MTGHAGGSANNPLRSSSFVTAVQTTPTGLTEAEAARRLRERGKQPLRLEPPYASILGANTFTVPNAILLVFGVLTITFGSWKDALFLGILVANIAIECFQEIAPNGSMHGSVRCAYLSPEAVVVRDGNERRVPVDEG